MENKVEIGFGIAGFILSITLLTRLIKKETITLKDAKEILSLAGNFSENPELLAGDPQVLQASADALKIAQGLLQTLLNQESPGA
jgi:hypothetical protein